MTGFSRATNKTGPPHDQTHTQATLPALASPSACHQHPGRVTAARTVAPLPRLPLYASRTGSWFRGFVSSVDPFTWHRQGVDGVVRPNPVNGLRLPSPSLRRSGVTMTQSGRCNRSSLPAKRRRNNRGPRVSSSSPAGGSQKRPPIGKRISAQDIVCRRQTDTTVAQHQSSIQ